MKKKKRAGYTINEKLVQELKKINLIQESKPWKPHITLGRNRGDTSIQGFEIPFEKKVWDVTTIELIKSDLENGGPHYTVLKSYELAQH